MLILGLNAVENAPDSDVSRAISGAHDSAAVLWRDGRIVAAAEEERFNRVKHSGAFPVQAIRHCLDVAQAQLSDVDAVAVGWRAETITNIAHKHYDFGGGRHCQAAEDWIGQGLALLGADGPMPPIRFFDHHACHAYSVQGWFALQDALVITLDGAGDGASGTVWSFEGGQGRELKRFRSVEGSLGLAYLNACRILGYDEFDEYKVMGLAPYGDPRRYAEVFHQIMTVGRDGALSVASLERQMEIFAQAGLLDDRRAPGEPFRQRDKDVAAGVQDVLEQTVLDLVAHYAAQTGHKTVGLAGGVFHNCAANGKILDRSLFARMCVVPAAHDAGLALGAAYLAAQGAGPKKGGRTSDDGGSHQSALLGHDVAHCPIGRTLDAWGQGAFVRYRKAPDPVGETADLLNSGEVVAWVQGAAEFGPRALGNRSILADPRPAENRDRINRLIKNREGYRPFAPAVPDEDLRRYFVVPDTDSDFGYMNFVVPVQPEWRERLGAITHADGTARIQAVASAHNPRFYDLLRAFGDRSGVPILLNTSYNNHVEPVVNDASDAIRTLLTTGLKWLVVEDFIVEKTGPCTVEGMRGLRYRIPADRIVQMRPGNGDRDEALFQIVGTPKMYSTRAKPHSLSKALILALSALPTESTCGDVFEYCQSHFDKPPQETLRELLFLWQERALDVYPPLAD